ncbi:hypothetical protein WJX79_005086 [Trebouxia sp. C0005]
MLTQAPEVCEQGPSQPTVRTSWSGGSASFWSSRPHRSQNWKLCKHLFPFRRENQRVQAGQQFGTAEALRAGTVLSSKAGERRHQSKETHAGKAEFLAEELSRPSIALCGLCEVRWPGQGQKPSAPAAA